MPDRKPPMLEYGRDSEPSWTLFDVIAIVFMWVIPAAVLVSFLIGLFNQ